VSYEQEQLENFKEQLRQAINKVPQRVVNGGVMETREWLDKRKVAERLLKSRNPTTSQLMGMINQLT
jgi:hypothetical protein